MTDQPKNEMTPGQDKAQQIADLIQSAMDAAYKRGVADTEAAYQAKQLNAYATGFRRGRESPDDVSAQSAMADYHRDAERAQHAVDWFKRNRPTVDDLPIRKEKRDGI